MALPLLTPRHVNRSRAGLALALGAALCAAQCAVLLAAPVPAHAAGPVVQAVAVQGVLQSGEFLGAPGFGDSAASDHAETVYFLQLPAPLAAQLRSTGPLADFSAAAQGSYFVVLVVFDEEQTVVRSLVGKKVRIVGSLVEADTPHRKSPALIQVKSVSPIREWQW
jgi:hypothetical protein